MGSNGQAGVSIDGLHRLLWHRSTDGRIRVQHKQLAEDLLLSRQRITQLLAELADQHRITKTPYRSVIDVTDPDTWHP